MYVKFEFVEWCALIVAVVVTVAGAAAGGVSSTRLSMEFNSNI